MTETLTFRPITRDDIPTLHRWRNLPHVSRWWDPPNPSYALCHDEYTAYMRPNYGVDAYIMQIDGKDIGYIQQWRVKSFPDYKPYVPLSDEAVGIDVFIGEVDYLHKGWGTKLMRQFICDYVFKDPNVPEVIIDPLPDNSAAIRSYEKTGFVHLKTFLLENKGVYLMKINRQHFRCSN